MTDIARLVPKTRILTESESPTSFESWVASMRFTVSLDRKFARFLDDLKTWKSPNVVNRGFVDDVGDQFRGDLKMTAVQKKEALETMLGVVAGYADIIGHSYIMKQATSLDDIFNRLRSRLGFRRAGTRILDLASLQIGPSESREALWERFYSFFEGNLLLQSSGMTHEGVKPEEDEQFTPTLLNVAVVLWLQAIHRGLPEFVKQRFATNLRSQTIFSIREEISDSIPSMLLELQNKDDASISRATGGFQEFRPFSRGRGAGYRGSGGQRGRSFKKCTLCFQAKRPDYQSHYLSQCPFLEAGDKAFMSKIRDVDVEDECHEFDDDHHYYEQTGNFNVVDVKRDVASVVANRISIVKSPALNFDVNKKVINFSMDTGAESSLISLDMCRGLGLKIEPTDQRASQADGDTPLETLGEFHSMAYRKCELNSSVIHPLQFNGLVVRKLSCPVLAGMPFLEANDISIRPALKRLYIGDCCCVEYGKAPTRAIQSSVPAIQSSAPAKTQLCSVIRVPEKICLLPGESVSVPVPIESDEVAVEPRYDAPSSKHNWLSCGVSSVSSGEVSLKNTCREPVILRRHEQVAQVRPTCEVDDTVKIGDYTPSPVVRSMQSGVERLYSSAVILDPSGMMSSSVKEGFVNVNTRYDSTFSPGIGKYNGFSGPFKHTINMGPSLPPQQRGRVPIYNRDKQVTLQQKCDELVAQGILAKPESVGVVAEYVSPSFLVAKSNGRYRLVSSFTGIGAYIKPQPSILPNVDDVLRQIGQWTCVIKTDLCDAYYHIELPTESMKYVGIATPFKGVHVYTRAVMGLPGSEGSLEELLSKILGDLIMAGSVVKLADDLYCGADTHEELLVIWEKVLELLSLNGLKLSAKKTEICPKSTTVLGWIWEQGTLRASPHRINALVECPPPETVKALRSFLGVYKFLCRVLPSYSDKLAPLEKITGGAKSADKITWTDDLIDAFNDAKAHLKDAKVLTLPRTDDQLQIITDASQMGIASALYTIRDRPYLVGVFNAQLKGSQRQWIPCEIEAYSIGCGVRHFGPYLAQSKKRTEVLTDSKPCVEAYGKLQKGQFSASARVTTFLSVISRYGVKVSHIAGQKNIFSDYLSRNPVTCDGNCQVCRFVETADASVVNEVKVSDVMSGNCAVPYTTRSTWYQSQQECPVLKQVAHFLADGRSPMKKKKGMTEVRRYLNVVKLSSNPNDGLLIVPQEVPLGKCRQRIVVPQGLLDGLLTALHLQLQHPSKFQLRQVFNRGFFALDADKSIERVVEGCHACAALKKVPARFKSQSTTVPVDEGIGRRFSTDVIRRERQQILLMKEYVSSYATACFVPNESAESLQEGVIRLLSMYRAPSGPPVVVRVDPATGFQSCARSRSLSELHITLELGEPKNINKNPVAERGIQEFHAEVARISPAGGPLDEVTLSMAVSNMNSRIRLGGLSASEIWNQRDMFTGDQLPIDDLEAIRRKASSREKGHMPSAKYQARGSVADKSVYTSVGDIVYLYQDRDKVKSRSRYIVTQVAGNKSHIQKFAGSQLRSRVYVVDNADIIKVQPYEYPLVQEAEDCSDEYVYEVGEQVHDHEGINQMLPQLQQVEEEPAGPVVDQAEDEPAEPVVDEVRRSSRVKKRPAYLEEYVSGGEEA